MANVKSKLNKLNKYLDFPDGVVTGEIHIELQSNKSAIIDGKCSILQYDDENVKINTGTGVIHFNGKKLNLDTLNKEGIQVSGIINKIEFI